VCPAVHFFIGGLGLKHEPQKKLEVVGEKEVFEEVKVVLADRPPFRAVRAESV